LRPIAKVTPLSESAAQGLGLSVSYAPAWVLLRPHEGRPAVGLIGGCRILVRLLLGGGSHSFDDPAPPGGAGVVLASTERMGPLERTSCGALLDETSLIRYQRVRCCGATPPARRPDDCAVRSTSVSDQLLKHKGSVVRRAVRGRRA